jgi:uncharacterized protein (TIGR03437 family)
MKPLLVVWMAAAATALAQPYVVNTIAGKGKVAYGGDGKAATTVNLFSPNRVAFDAAAALPYPRGIAADGAGNVYVGTSSRLCKITGGIVRTIAGTGSAGYFGNSVTSRPAVPGEVILLFGTGFGPTTPAVPTGQIFSGAAPLADPTQLHMTIGGAAATVQFAGMVAAGEYQFNVVIPPVGDGDQAIVATIAGFATQSGLSISVKN